MKAIKSNVSKALQKKSMLVCADNSGAKLLEIIAVKGYRGVKRRYPKAGIGDVVVVSIKKGVPEMRKQISTAVIIRQKKEYKRPDGSTIQFEDNAAVIMDESGETKASEIKGPASKEAAERFPKIASLASIIV